MPAPTQDWGQAEHWARLGAPRKGCVDSVHDEKEVKVPQQSSVNLPSVVQLLGLQGFWQHQVLRGVPATASQGKSPVPP